MGSTRVGVGDAGVTQLCAVIAYDSGPHRHTGNMRGRATPPGGLGAAGEKRAAVYADSGDRTVRVKRDSDYGL